MMENIVGKEENAGYQHFLLFRKCFQKVYAWGVGVVKSQIAWLRVKSICPEQGIRLHYYIASRTTWCLQKCHFKRKLPSSRKYLTFFPKPEPWSVFTNHS